MIDEIAQISGHWGVMIADDFPSPNQLSDIESDGWMVTQIIPSQDGTKQVSANKFVVYMRRGTMQ